MCRPILRGRLLSLDQLSLDQLSIVGKAKREFFDDGLRFNDVGDTDVGKPGISTLSCELVLYTHAPNRISKIVRVQHASRAC